MTACPSTLTSSRTEHRPSYWNKMTGLRLRISRSSTRMCVLAHREQIAILSWHNRWNKEDVTAGNETGEVEQCRVRTFHTASVPNWRTQQRSRVKGKVAGLMKRAGTADNKTNGYLWEWEVDRGSWGKMICGHQSCYRHGAETWDRIKTTQALIVCLETDLLELRKQQWPLKKYSSFSYQRSYFYNPRMQLGVCVRVCVLAGVCARSQTCWGRYIGRPFIIRTRTFRLRVFLAKLRYFLFI